MAAAVLQRLADHGNCQDTAYCPGDGGIAALAKVLRQTRGRYERPMFDSPNTEYCCVMLGPHGRHAISVLVDLGRYCSLGPALGRAKGTRVKGTRGYELSGTACYTDGDTRKLFAVGDACEI